MCSKPQVKQKMPKPDTKKILLLFTLCTQRALMLPTTDNSNFSRNPYSLLYLVNSG